MRYVLINTHIILLAIYAFITVATGGGIASLAAAGAGGGPAAMGVWVYIMVITVVALVGFAAFVLPLSIVSALNLLFALTSGYRHLRWTRFLGVAVNLLGIAFFLLAPRFFDFIPLAPIPFLLALLLFNFVLFMLMPKRPWRRLTRRVMQAAIPILYFLPIALFALVILVRPADFTTVQYLLLATILLGYTLPFLYCLRTVPATKTPDRRLLRRLLFCGLFSLLGLLLIFPLGLPLFAGTLMLLELSELSLLHPRIAPAPGGFHYWIASVLGTPPDGAADRDYRRKETDHDGHNRQEGEGVSPPTQTRQH